MSKTTRQIWVYGDLRNEKFFGLSLNILAKARELAQSVNTRVAMVLLKTSEYEKKVQKELLSISEAAERAVKHGADTVYIIDGCGLDILRADAFAFALSETVSKQNPMLFCFPLTDFCRELAAGGGTVSLSDASAMWRFDSEGRVGTDDERGSVIFESPTLWTMKRG